MFPFCLFTLSKAYPKARAQDEWLNSQDRDLHVLARERAGMGCREVQAGSINNSKFTRAEGQRLEKRLLSSRWSRGFALSGGVKDLRKL